MSNFTHINKVYVLPRVDIQGMIESLKLSNTNAFDD
jgi:hypothetical protein